MRNIRLVPKLMLVSDYLDPKLLLRDRGAELSENLKSFGDGDVEANNYNGKCCCV